MFVAAELIYLIPEILVATMTCLALMASAIWHRRYKFLVYGLTQSTYLAAAIAVVWVSADHTRILMNGHFITDDFADVSKIISLIFAVVANIYAQTYLQTHQSERGEYYVLGLFAVLGMMVVISAHSLLTMYMGIELMSMSMYVMIAYDRTRLLAAEAAIKFFMLSAVATGILLYGFSLVYGATGSLNLSEIQRIGLVESGYQQLFLVGLVLIIIGAAFKMALVPFHFWIPDVYQGGNLASVTFIASVPKIAGLAILIRLFTYSLSFLIDNWQDIFLGLGILALIFGNVVALAQSNIRRMLAYSSIGHMGFIVLALACGSTSAYSLALFYTVVYAIGALGIFGVLIELDRNGIGTVRIKEMAGLYKRHRMGSAMLLLLLFSMIGIPPMLGFYAKFGVILELVNASMLWPAAAAVLATVIGAYYYLRVIKVLYFDDAPTDVGGQVCACDPIQIRIAIVVNGLLVLILGLAAQPLIELSLRVFSWAQ